MEEIIRNAYITIWPVYPNQKHSDNAWLFECYAAIIQKFEENGIHNTLSDIEASKEGLHFVIQGMLINYNMSGRSTNKKEAPVDAISIVFETGECVSEYLSLLMEALNIYYPERKYCLRVSLLNQYCFIGSQEIESLIHSNPNYVTDDNCSDHYICRNSQIRFGFFSDNSTNIRAVDIALDKDTTPERIELFLNGLYNAGVICK